MIGINETVYCIINVGDLKFKTREKYIDNLQFYDENEVFTARINIKEFQKAFNQIITFSVNKMHILSAYHYLLKIKQLISSFSKGLFQKVFSE